MKRGIYAVCLAAMLSGSLHAGWDVLVKGDFLYWNAREDGLEYVEYAGDLFFGGNNQIIFNDTATTKDPNFCWDPGFRLGVAFIDPCSRLALGINWTHLSSEAKSKINKPEDSLYYIKKRDVFSQVSPDFDIVDSFFGKAKWDLEYNVLDFEASAPVCFCHCSRVIVTPLIGIRAAWIHQKFNNSINTFNGPFETTRYEKIKNDFSGAGVRAGFNLNVDLCKGFQLVAGGSGSLLYGEFDVSDKVESNALRNLGDYHSHRCSVRPNLEGTIGLVWNKEICDCTREISFSVGYDLSYWFDQNQIPGQIEPDVTKSSDLYFQGIHVGAGYTF